MNINLLPQSALRELAEYRRIAILNTIGFIVTIFLISLALGLLAVMFRLEGEAIYAATIQEAAEKDLSRTQSAATRDKIKQTNALTAKILSFYDEREEFYPLLPVIISSLPDQLYLDSMSYNQKENKITLSGFSPRREQLLEFKSNLEQHPEFSQVFFPTSNWVKAREITFFVTLNIDGEK